MRAPWREPLPSAPTLIVPRSEAVEYQGLLRQIDQAKRDGDVDRLRDLIRQSTALTDGWIATPPPKPRPWWRRTFDWFLLGLVDG